MEKKVKQNRKKAVRDLKNKTHFSGKNNQINQYQTII
jgi:hypothetical protein